MKKSAEDIVAEYWIPYSYGGTSRSAMLNAVIAYAKQVRDECARIADNHVCKRRDEYYPCCDDLAEKFRKLEIKRGGGKENYDR